MAKFDLSKPADLRVAAPEKPATKKARARRNGRRVWDTTSVNYNYNSAAAYAPRYEARAHEPEFRRGMIAQELARDWTNFLIDQAQVAARPEDAALREAAQPGALRLARSHQLALEEARKASPRAMRRAARAAAHNAAKAAASKE